jgi:site-specific recombinase XerC
VRLARGSINLSPATKRQRENIFKHVLEQAGTKPYALIRRQHVIDGRERRSFLDVMRGLLAWAVEAGHVKNDPTIGVKNPPRKRRAGL